MDLKSILTFFLAFFISFDVIQANSVSIDSPPSGMTITEIFSHLDSAIAFIDTTEDINEIEREALILFINEPLKQNIKLFGIVSFFVWNKLGLFLNANEDQKYKTFNDFLEIVKLSRNFNLGSTDINLCINHLNVMIENLEETMIAQKSVVGKLDNFEKEIELDNSELTDLQEVLITWKSVVELLKRYNNNLYGTIRKLMNDHPYLVASISFLTLFKSVISLLHSILKYKAQRIVKNE